MHLMEIEYNLNEILAYLDNLHESIEIKCDENCPDCGSSCIDDLHHKNFHCCSQQHQW